MAPITIAAIALWAAQNIANYGFNKGLDKLFSNKNDFINHLNKVIHQTIEEYGKIFPVKEEGGMVAFYKSEILITEFLKFRIFSVSNYNFDESNIQLALKQNPNIILPSNKEIERFTLMFDEFVNEDPVLKALEIEAFYKEEIFKIRPVLTRLESRLELFSTNGLNMLEGEYNAEIETFKKDLKGLKAKTALENLVSIEKRIQENSENISSQIMAHLYHLKASCCELIGMDVEAKQNHIKAHKRLPNNIRYLDRACISYYRLKDNKYKELFKKLSEEDDYNPVLWAIRVYQSTDVLNFIQTHVPKLVLDDNRFKRLVFSHYLKETSFDIKDLLNRLEFNKLYNDLPEQINNENFFYAVTVLNAISTTFFRQNSVPFWGFIKRDELSLQFLNLSRLLVSSIISGELDPNLNNIVFYAYWIENEIDYNESTLANLEQSYNKLSEKQNFIILLYATALFKRGDFKKTIKVLDTYAGDYDENLFSFRAFIELSHLGSASAAFQYFDKLKLVDDVNLHNVCSFITAILANNLAAESELKAAVDKVTFENKNYKNLTTMLFDTLSKDKGKISLDDIEDLKNKLEENSSVSFYIAQILFENGYYNETSEFIKTFLNENEESRELRLYIYSLNAQKKENQVELLRLLKKWRENFSFNLEFLNIELNLRQILKDWDEIYHIAKHGYRQLPENESIFTSLVLATAWVNKYDEIEQYLPKLKDFKFQSTENVLRIFSVLVDAKYFEDALNLLYEKAKNKLDALARQNFFFVSHAIPKKFYKNYKKVKIGRYVKLEINEVKKVLYVDKDTLKNQPILQGALGRKVNEEFSISVGLNKKLEKARIIAVMNKFMALSDDIMEDAVSPFSAMEMEQIKIDTSSKEKMDEAFIQSFGGQQLARKKHTDEVIKKYYRYEVSFSELVRANFEDSYFDAYLSLTSELYNGFLIRPISTYPVQHLNKDQNFVIDFSSGLLFYHLSQKLDLQFSRFVISNNLIHLIDALIRKTELSKSTKMSMTIENNRVVTHFIPKDFHKRRKEKLVEIKEWFEANCDIVVPEEKLNLMRQLDDQEQGNETDIGFLVDNALIAQRDNHFLISEDMVYSKHLRIIENTCSSEMYLKQFFASKEKEILAHLIEHRYVGLTLSADVIYDCYINQHKEGMNHIFKYALRNLSLKLGSQIENIEIVITFLKRIALSPVISPEKYKIDTTNTLVALLIGVNNVNEVLYLKASIQKEFRLTGDYLAITLKCLLDSMSILNVSGSV